MKNLFLFVFLSFAVVCYYLNKIYWSKVTDPNYSGTGQVDTLEITSSGTESKLTEIREIKKLTIDSIKTGSQSQPAL